MGDPPILDIKDLSKSYRRVQAVKDLHLTVSAGEFVALIGPNGAGKSTTMGTIAGTVAPDEGSVQIAGHSVSDAPLEARRRLGFVPQHLTLLDYLTGLEYLHFVADLRHLDEDDRDHQVDELLGLTELDDARHTVLREYSGGMLRKLALASALLGAPPLLVLDESFVGLDPESTHRLRKRLRRHCDDGGAIVLSSHILDMLQGLCDRFVILSEGALVEDIAADAVDDLTDRYLQVTGKADAIAVNH